MCRALSNGGRRCPCRASYRHRRAESARQRVSRYARWCDAAADAGDTEAATKYAAMLDQAVSDLEQLGGWRSTPAPVERHTRAGEFTPERTASWADEQLERALSECWDDPEAVDAIAAVIDAREAPSADVDQLAAEHDRLAVDVWARQPEWAEPDALTSPARRQPKRSRAQIARAEYEAYLDVQWMQAEADCNGQLLTPAARAAGVDSRSLFSGPINRALRHASEELQSWWGAHGRLSLAAFRYQALGWDSDRDAADRTRRETFDNAAAW